jgi:hypothetical protein
VSLIDQQSPLWVAKNIENIGMGYRVFSDLIAKILGCRGAEISCLAICARRVTMELVACLAYSLAWA